MARTKQSTSGRAGSDGKSSGTKGGAGKRRKGWRTAAESDPHDLYERSVQDPESEMELIEQVWRERRGRLPSFVREDFCGTAAASAAWVKRRRGNRAVGVDIDPAVLAWAKRRLPERLKPAQRKRLKLIEGDVLKVTTPEPPDCVLAMNFSYFLFRTRKELKRYFRRVHRNLAEGGLFMLDAYGGSESYLELEEERDLDGFTYVWDQRLYNPVTGEVINHIHFRFPDGTEIKDAFIYHWRLWSLPEIQELLQEAGFREVTVYWEGTDEDTGEGSGEFAPTTRGEACAAWIAYLVAEK